MSWIREAISDDQGLADMAYVSIGWLVAIMVASIVFLCAMSAVSYARCTQIVDVGQGVRSAIPCSYDESLKSLGISIAACLGAFGSPIGALALYMGQTRRQPAQPKPGTTVATATVTQTPAADDSTPPPKPRPKGKELG